MCGISLVILVLLVVLRESLAFRDEYVCKDADDPSVCFKITQLSQQSEYNTYECVYYLAPSSIRHSGLGVYTVKDIPTETLLMKQSDAPSIVLSDVRNHNWGIHLDPLTVHRNYVNTGYDLANFEVDAFVEESAMTLGAFANHHPYLFNIYHFGEEMNDSITPRESGSPGIGAYSYNMGYNYKAYRDILAGEELFLNYGDYWLDTRPNSEKVPRWEDFMMGAKVVETMISTGVQSHDLTDKMISSIRQIVSLWQERAAETLPSSLNDFADMLNQDPNSDIARALAKKSLIPRTVDWIRSKGVCVDNLIPNVSTLHDAGQGAFAQRLIPQGSIVVPAPVIQIIDATELNMYDFDTDTRIGTQLLINYCFAHPGTTLLLCPQTNAILINHCSNRSLASSYGGDCDRYNSHNDVSSRGPNAYVRWASEWDPDTDTSLKMSWDDLYETTKEGKRLLSMEIIASRDIFPGDEVFIDYGEEWEQAWYDHVQRWDPPSATNYVPIKQMNEYVVDLKTPDELELYPYPQNVRLACRYSDIIHEFEEEEEKDEDDYNNDEERLWITQEDVFMHSIDIGNLWPCSVIDRKQGGSDGIYTVEIFQSHSFPSTKWDKLAIRRIIEQFPRQSIFFRPQSKSIDHYLRGVFRQPLGLPPNMVVDNWMI